MELWRVVARSFPHAPRTPDSAAGVPPQSPSPDICSKASPGLPVHAHRAPGAVVDRTRCTQILGEQAYAAPTGIMSFSLRLLCAGAPDTQAMPELPSTLCLSNIEHSQNH